MKYCKESEYWRKVSIGSIYLLIIKINLQNLFVLFLFLFEQQKIVDKLNFVIRGVDEICEVSFDVKVIEENLFWFCILGLMLEKEGLMCEIVKFDIVCEVIFGNLFLGESYNEEGEGMCFLQG